jgi:hypothetical protein
MKFKMHGREDHWLYFCIKGIDRYTFEYNITAGRFYECKKSLHYCGELGFVVETGQEAVSIEFAGKKIKEISKGE